MAELQTISAVLGIVKNTWHALEFIQSTCHAREDARRLWERTNDLYLLIAKIDSSISDHEGKNLDRDILFIVQNALRSSNRTLDELARRCSKLGDKEDLAMIYRLTRPIYFTLSDNSIRKYEQQFQTHIMSMQIAFMLLERSEKQQIFRRLTGFLDRIETSSSTAPWTIKSSRFPLAETVQRDDNVTKADPISDPPASTASPLLSVADTQEFYWPSSLLTCPETPTRCELRESPSPSVNSNESESSLTLTEATKSASIQGFQQLLGDGVSAQEVNARSYAALHIAIEHDNLPAAEMLLSHDTNIIACSPTTPLLRAVQLNRPQFIRMFLAYQPTARLNIADTSGWTLVHHATYLASSAALTALLEAAGTHNIDIDLNARCELSWTPLMHLAERGHVPANFVMAKGLLDHGAGVNVKDAFGFPALYYAVTSGAPTTQRNKFVAMLVEKEADVEMAMAKVPKRIVERFWGLRKNENGSRDSEVAVKDGVVT